MPSKRGALYQIAVDMPETGSVAKYNFSIITPSKIRNSGRNHEQLMISAAKILGCFSENSILQQTLLFYIVKKLGLCQEAWDNPNFFLVLFSRIIWLEVLPWVMEWVILSFITTNRLWEIPGILGSCILLLPVFCSPGGFSIYDSKTANRDQSD